MQLAYEQAQSMEAANAAEERIQALEQRLASQQDANQTQQAAAGDPPAMAAPGTLTPLSAPFDHLSAVYLSALVNVGSVCLSSSSQAFKSVTLRVLLSAA